MLVIASAAVGQSPTATINGLVLDPSGAVVSGAEIIVVNEATRVQYAAKTSGDGIYVVTNLPPGTYRLQVSKIGFKTLVKPDIVLNVQDAVAINFTLPVGAASETVTVEGGAPLVNTQSGSVSTVIDHNLVESLPLNGRSFNTLLQLTPGVVVAPEPVSGTGQFSIAGQRPSSNNFLVDGVSANFGVAPTQGQGTSGTGSAQAFSVLGGTSSLVSVEALQEFRVETSSFAPEFGRAPGGQVILTTRSGANDFHGTLYEYFRNNVLDANDWFAKEAGKPRAAERHNDFGGSLGGPIQKDKTFFFLSYEGARLRQPATLVAQVPSEAARMMAGSSPVAPFIDAYPEPDNKTVTPGVFTETFTGSFSNPATLDAGSVRIDHTFASGASIFARYNEAPSEAVVRNNSLNFLQTTEVDTRTVTLGSTMGFGARTTDTFRANYSFQKAGLASQLDSFGGAVPPSLGVLAPGLPNPSGALLAFDAFDAGFYLTGPDARNSVTQLNFADDLMLVRGTHQLKFGGDYRGIYFDFRPPQVSLSYLALSVSELLSSGQAFEVLGQIARPSYFFAPATSLYAQDTWKVAPRVSLNYGLRWELSRAPSARGGTILASWTNVNNPAALSLAPAGTELWRTTYGNFAPRAGVAWSLTPAGDLVLRGGAGVFYDLASDTVGELAASFPNSVGQPSFFASLPLADATPFLPSSFSLAPPFPNPSNGFDPRLKLPRSYQWNVALEKSIGGQQAVSLSYVGQAGRDLLRQQGISQPNANFAGAFVLTGNGARSNYNALELQYRRPVSTTLQLLLNYTWSHSLDNASNDIVEALSNTVVSAAADYASSDFDVRHSLSSALTWTVPAATKRGWLKDITEHWSLYSIIVVRTGFPFNAVAPAAAIAGANPRPDLVRGEPFFLTGSACSNSAQFAPVLNGGPCPGGKGLNPAAFVAAPMGEQGSEGRNDIPGFGLTQVDFSVNRKFRISDRFNLQFRADAFNLLNHPNFTNPAGAIGFGPANLLSAAMLNYGLGGLNPLFQEGGPRSLQLSLKLSF